jgi:7SK snRNA methylphosphate capping enzyme
MSTSKRARSPSDRQHHQQRRRSTSRGRSPSSTGRGHGEEAHGVVVPTAKDLTHILGDFDPHPDFVPWGSSSSSPSSSPSTAVWADARLDAVPAAVWRGASGLGSSSVLDVGCGAGYAALLIAERWLHTGLVSSVLGIDASEALVQRARKLAQWRGEQAARGATGAAVPAPPPLPSVPPPPPLPLSLALCQGISADRLAAAQAALSRRQAASSSSSSSSPPPPPPPAAPLPSPPAVSFRTEDFVAGTVYATPTAAYDVVLCLEVTKWVHLAHGDEGLLLLFRRIHQALKPGGYLVLAAQPWASYRRKGRRMGEAVWRTYQSLRLRPGEFEQHLVGRVGFVRVAPEGEGGEQGGGGGGGGGGHRATEKLEEEEGEVKGLARGPRRLTYTKKNGEERELLVLRKAGGGASSSPS